MVISIFEFAAICVIFAAVILLLKFLSYRSWKKYFYEDENGTFKNHFTWKRFFRDLISLELFRD